MVKPNIASTVFRSIVFENPVRLVPPLAWVGYNPFAFWIVDVHRAKVVVELGTHSGNRYFRYCTSGTAPGAFDAVFCDRYLDGRRASGLLSGSGVRRILSLSLYSICEFLPPCSLDFRPGARTFRSRRC